MKIFNLPDLGEGLAEAEIREWHVKEGDTVKLEQLLVGVETAKAVVDVPSPYAGKIEKLYGHPGDIIKTGAPLIGFAAESTAARADTGTVVGSLETSQTVLTETHPAGIVPTRATALGIKATPAVRSLAKHLKVDLTTITGTGPENAITFEDVQLAAQSNKTQTTYTPSKTEQLKGARRAMAIGMTKAHKEIVPISLMDVADISNLGKVDLTVFIMRGIIAACEKEPALNAQFNGEQLTRELFHEVNIGLAVDTPDGLYVPVIKNVKEKTDEELRAAIEKLKQQAKQQKFSPDDLKGATVALSNFGAIAGRFANPMIVPPSVAILGVGKSYKELKLINQQITERTILPLSITFDHRAVTGGEAARFLATVINYLEK